MSGKKLGKGLEALISNPVKESADRPDSSPEVVSNEIDISLIRPNPYQPRDVFDEGAITALSESIKADGLLQPVLVRKVDHGYELIAGERRWRASKRAGLLKIPCSIAEKSDSDLLKLALIENLQREDLNPIEKARAFRSMMETNSLTQEDTAKMLGINRSSLANFVRLLDLSSVVQEAVSRGTISMGHGRSLLSVNDNVSFQLDLLKRIVKEDLSVRAVEQIIAINNRPKLKIAIDDNANHFRDLEEQLSAHLQTKVQLKAMKKGGVLNIKYYNNAQLDEIFKKMGFISS